MSLSRHQSSDDNRSCWVCFATDEDDREALWVKPCKCRGTTMWVHQNCLQRWIDEKQKGNSNAKVACPQCNTEYIIIFPRLGTLISIMEPLDRLIDKMCPFVAGGIFIGSLYWTMVTYGAVTVMQSIQSITDLKENKIMEDSQKAAFKSLERTLAHKLNTEVLGHKEGLSVMEGSDPLVLLIGLPLIPSMLILGKMIRWEDYVLRLWRKHCMKLPILKYLFPKDYANLARTPAETANISDPISITRMLCGALILPTIATTAGKVLFGNVSSNFQRTLLGGVAFVAIKGVLKIYYKQQQYIRQANRIIQNYETPAQDSSVTVPRS